MRMIFTRTVDLQGMIEVRLAEIIIFFVESRLQPFLSPKNSSVDHER